MLEGLMVIGLFLLGLAGFVGIFIGALAILKKIDLI